MARISDTVEMHEESEEGDEIVRQADIGRCRWRMTVNECIEEHTRKPRYELVPRR